MGNIPSFQRNVISQQTVFQSPQSVQAGYERISQGIGVATDAILTQSQKMKQASDYTSVNEKGLAVQARLNDRLDQFQRENSSSPQGKYQDFDKIASEELVKERDSLPSDDAKMMFDKYSLQLRDDYTAKMQHWENQTQAFNFAQSVENAADTNNKMAYMDGNLDNVDKYVNQAHSTAVAGSTVVDPQHLEAVQKKTSNGAVKALLMGAAEKNPAAARAALKDPRFNQHLEADDLATLDNHFESLGKQQEAQAREAKNRQSQGIVNKLYGDMAEGKDVSLEAHDLYKKDQIDGGQLMTLVTKQKKANKDILTDQAGRDKMQLVQNGQAVLNPTDKGDMKALDSYYSKTFVPTLQELAPDDQARAVSTFVGQFGAVPPSLRTQIDGTLLAGNPEQQLKTATMVNNLVTENPRVAGQLDDKTLGYAMKLNDLSNAGVPLTQAVKAAQESQFLGGTPEYAARLKDYNQAANGKSPTIAFDPGAFNQAFRDDPNDIPPEMKRQWDTLAKTYYVDQGLNPDSAMQLANSKIAQTWAISTVGKGGQPQWMKYAPEAYYGGDSEWVKDQLVSDLREAGVLGAADKGGILHGERGAKIKNDLQTDEFMKSAYLVPVPNNLNQGKPSYYVYREQDGIQNLVIATNPKNGVQEAVVFQPDQSKTPEGRKLSKKTDEARAKMMEKADKAYNGYLTERKTRALKDQGINFQDNPMLPAPPNPSATGQGA